MLTYQMYDRGAVLITRQAESCSDELKVSVIGAPIGATLLFRDNDGKGTTFYRALRDGACTVPFVKMSGAVKVTLILQESGKLPERLSCEGLFVKTAAPGVVTVEPDDTDIHSHVSQLLMEHGEIRRELTETKEKLEKLTRRVEAALEGYDVT